MSWCDFATTSCIAMKRPTIPQPESSPPTATLYSTEARTTNTSPPRHGTYDVSRDTGTFYDAQRVHRGQGQEQADVPHLVHAVFLLGQSGRQTWSRPLPGAPRLHHLVPASQTEVAIRGQQRNDRSRGRRAHAPCDASHRQHPGVLLPLCGASHRQPGTQERFSHPGHRRIEHSRHHHRRRFLLGDQSQL